MHDGAMRSERSAPPDDRIALQLQARALGEPSRHRIFRYVVDADHPVDIIELTTALGLHHNAIRQHLAKLVAARLVVEGTAPATGRGRPRLRYSPAPEIDSRWGATGPYERLAVLLTEIIRTGDAPVEVGRRAGRLAGEQRAATAPGADPVDVFVDEMARQGFDPVAVAADDDVEVVLRACPFSSTAMADPETVCGLHLGLARGMADAIGGLEIDELVPLHPEQPHCELRVHLMRAGEITSMRS